MINLFLKLKAEHNVMYKNLTTEVAAALGSGVGDNVHT
jgi:hypothetical protein